MILNYSEAGYTDSTYTIKIVKFEGTKTTVSEDGKTFTVKPINIKAGSTLVAALYDGNEFIGTHTTLFDGTDFVFTTDKAYTAAKVMVWNTLDSMTPVCEPEAVE